MNPKTALITLYCIAESIACEPTQSAIEAPTPDSTMEKLTPEEFVDAVIQLGRINGYSLSHEDCGGAFLVVDFNPENAEWLRQAENRTTPIN